MAAAAVLVVPMLAACGSDDHARENRARPKIVVVAREDGFAVPSTLPSGWVDVTLENAGLREHQIAFVELGSLPYAKFKGGAAVGDFSALPADTVFAGGPGAVAPGQSLTASIHLDPGAYAVACFVRDPGGRELHAAEGMVASVEVEPSALSVGSVPSGADTIEVRDFDFDLAPTFHGAGTIAITNTGRQVHEVRIYRLARNKGITDARQYLLTPAGRQPSGPPPISAVGGASAFEPAANPVRAHVVEPGDLRARRHAARSVTQQQVARARGNAQGDHDLVACLRCKHSRGSASSTSRPCSPVPEPRATSLISAPT